MTPPTQIIPEPRDGTEFTSFDSKDWCIICMYGRKFKSVTLLPLLLLLCMPKTVRYSLTPQYLHLSTNRIKVWFPAMQFSSAQVKLQCTSEV